MLKCAELYCFYCYCYYCVGVMRDMGRYIEEYGKSVA